MTKKILFLFSDTGGGHRSATEATIEAITRLYPHIQTQMVDVFQTYSPPPFPHAASIYSRLSRHPHLWQGIFKSLNHPRTLTSLHRLLSPYISPHLTRLLLDHPADLVVSTHPAFTTPIISILKRRHYPAPLAILVTDLVTLHRSWLPPGAARYLLPTPQALNLALQANLPPDSLILTGLPVHQKFTDILSTPVSRIRTQLHLHPHLPTILLMGGGQGMGKLYTTATALASSSLQLQLLIVAGRNPRLHQQLSHTSWPVPTQIFGFTDLIPLLMRASDVLVTKGGPSTIAEALTVGLPILVFDYLPGQETGNISFIESSGSGSFAPSPPKVVSTLATWLASPARLAQMKKSAHELSQSQSAANVAHQLHRLL